MADQKPTHLDSNDPLDFGVVAQVFSLLPDHKLEGMTLEKQFETLSRVLLELELDPRLARFLEFRWALEAVIRAGFINEPRYWLSDSDGDKMGMEESREIASEFFTNSLEQLPLE